TRTTAFSSRRDRFTIDCLGQNSCASSLAYTPWPTKQKGLRQLIIMYSVLQRVGHMLLPHDRVEGNRTVFTGRDNEVIHQDKDRYLAINNKRNLCGSFRIIIIKLQQLISNN